MTETTREALYSIERLMTRRTVSPAPHRWHPLPDARPRPSRLSAALVIDYGISRRYRAMAAFGALGIVGNGNRRKAAHVVGIGG